MLNHCDAKRTQRVVRLLQSASGGGQTEDLLTPSQLTSTRVRPSALLGVFISSQHGVYSGCTCGRRFKSAGELLAPVHLRCTPLGFGVSKFTHCRNPNLLSNLTLSSKHSLSHSKDSNSFEFIKLDKILQISNSQLSGSPVPESQ